jgi:hypothetical protein
MGGRPFLLRNRAALVAVGLLAAACSTIQIAYNFADVYIEREAAFHLDLDDDGEALLDRQVDAFMAWHRARMLPAYTAYLRAQADRVEAGPITEAAVADAFDRLRELWEETVRGVAPYAATVLVRHTAPAKRAFLQARLDERWAESAESLREPTEERIARRTARIVENFERFTGPLGETQRRIIADYAGENLNDRARWLNHRRLRNEAFVAFLASRPNQPEITRFIERIVLHSYEVVEPEYKAFADARAVRFKTLLYDVIASMTPAERKRVAENLRSFADDFSELSAAAR